MVSFNSLPFDILSLILEYITHRRDIYACALTNKQMYLVSQPSLYHSLIQSIDDDVDTARRAFANLQFVLPASEFLPPRIDRHLRRLRICSGDLWTDSRLLILMRNTPQLEEFYLRSANKVTDASMMHLPKYWPNLVTLSLTHVPGMTALPPLAPKFTKLILECCKQLVSGMFVSPHLLTLGVRSLVPLLTTETAIWDLILYLPNLTDLRLSHDMDGFTHKLLLAAATTADVWPYLTSFTLYDVSGNDDTLVSFLRNHQGIQRLYFRHFGFDREKGLDELVSVVLPCLMELHITDWEKPDSKSYDTDLARAIRQWIQVCPQLEFILFCGYGITSPLFSEAGVKCGEMRGCNWKADCHFLHHLDKEDIEKIRDG